MSAGALADSSAETKWVRVSKWAAIAGHWTTSLEPGPRFVPALAPNNLGIALANARFRDGVVRCGIKFESNDGAMTGESAGIVLGYHPELATYHVVGLGAFEAAYAIWEFTGTGWQGRRVGGMIQNLQYNHDYSIEVVQKGQRLSLQVDDVLVLEHVLSSPLAGNQLGLYAMSKSPVQFGNLEIQQRAPTAFVVMQFGPPYDVLYKEVIRKVAKSLDFEVVRIDEVSRPGIIFQDIQRKIQDAKVIIAEITAPNQNVYYEVGYADALNKPIILLAQRGKELPFDIHSYRVIFYDDSIGGKPAVEKTLREYLRTILQEL